MCAACGACQAPCLLPAPFLFFSDPAGLLCGLCGLCGKIGPYGAALSDPTGLFYRTLLAYLIGPYRTYIAYTPPPLFLDDPEDARPA